MTIRKLAKMVNVSPSTVSKALAGSKEISDDTIALVRKAAEETGYIVGQNARRRESRKTKNPNVVILCPEIISVFYSTFASQLADRIEELGGIAYLHTYGFDPSQQSRTVMRCLNNGFLDGAVVVSCTARSLPGVQAPVINVLEVGGAYGDYDSVQSNLAKGINEAVLYLKGLGHTRIGFIGENLTGMKCGFFHAAMSDAGLILSENDVVNGSERFEEAGYRAAEKIIASGSMATAYIAGYDEIAIGAIKAFAANGISVPEDVSIIGINDISTASYIGTPLTSIRSHMDEICRIALAILTHKLNDRGYNIVQHVDVDSELIIRKTTAAPKKRPDAAKNGQQTNS